MRVCRSFLSTVLHSCRAVPTGKVTELFFWFHFYLIAIYFFGGQTIKPLANTAFFYLTVI